MSIEWLIVGVGLIGVGVYAIATAVLSRSVTLLRSQERRVDDYERFGWGSGRRAPTRVERAAGVVTGVMFIVVGSLWLLSG